MSDHESTEEKKPKELLEPIEVSAQRDKALTDAVRALYPLAAALEPPDEDGS